MRKSAPAQSDDHRTHGSWRSGLLIVLLAMSLAVNVGLLTILDRQDVVADQLQEIERSVELIRMGRFNDMIDRAVAGAATDHERCVRVAEHIARHVGNDYLGLGPPITSDQISWWELRRGLCSVRATLMVNALHRLNIRAHKWNIYDYGFAHNAVQAYYDGGWHYFDPTYAGYFADEAGGAMSWEEIAADPERAFDNMVVFDTTLDLYSSGERVDPEERMRTTYAPDRVARVQAAGRPWSRQFTLPVRVNTPSREGERISYGVRDGSSDDMRFSAPAVDDGSGGEKRSEGEIVRDVASSTRCHYMNALGMLHDNFVHELHLQTLRPGQRCRITFHLSPRRQGPARLVASASTGIVVEGAEGPRCEEAERWSFVYEAGDGPTHIVTAGLSSDDVRSFAEVDAFTVELERAGEPAITE